MHPSNLTHHRTPGHRAWLTLHLPDGQHRVLPCRWTERGQVEPDLPRAEAVALAQFLATHYPGDVPVDFEVTLQAERTISASAHMDEDGELTADPEELNDWLHQQF